MQPKNGEPPSKDTITGTCIMDCPTITVHAGKLKTMQIAKEMLENVTRH